MQPVVLNLAQNSFTSTYKYNMHKVKERPHITSSDRVIILHHMKVKITLFQTKLHHYEKWTTWNWNRLLQGWLQVNSVTRALILAGTIVALWR